MSDAIKLTAERLRALLHYDPISGIFTRRMSASNMPAGSVAGSLAKNGYLRARVDGQFHYCHRLAWLYMTSTWPKNQIDHKNGIRSDNAFANLRDSEPSENAENISAATKNASGFKGVYWNAESKKWQAKIMKNGKSKSLGYFDSPEAAHRAYVDGKAQIHSFQPKLRPE